MNKFRSLIFDFIKPKYFIANSARMGAAGSGGSGIPFYGYTSAVIADGAAAYWKLDEATGSTAVDYASSLDGTYTNGVTKGVAKLISDSGGTAVSFDGTNDFITMGDVLDFDQGDRFSIEFLINTTDDGGGSGASIISKQSNTAPYSGYSLYVYINYIYISLIGTTYANRLESHYAVAINDGEDHHVVWTYNGSSNISGMKLSVDGVFQTMTTDVNNLSTSTVCAEPFNIGARNSVDIFVSAVIDEVAVYATALPEITVRKHKALSLGYASATYPFAVITDGAIGYWRLGETTASTAYSDVNHVMDGTYTNGVTKGVTSLVSTETDTAASFDGTNDYVSVTDTTDLKITGNITVETIVAFSSTQTGKYIVSKWDNAAQLSYILNIPATNNVFQFAIRTGGATKKARSTPTYNDGNSHHVMGTYDGSNIKLYVDKVLVDSSAVTGSITDSTADFVIGAGDGNISNFDGTIDDTAIYATALTSAQVSSHFAATGL